MTELYFRGHVQGHTLVQVYGEGIHVDAGMSKSIVYLSTHADRQGVDISFTVFYVCLYGYGLTDLSAEDKAIGVKLFSAVHRRPKHGNYGISHFCELCSPRSPKSEERRARGPRPPACKDYVEMR